MELKKGYKQTEVGTIPSDWEVRELSELGKFKNGINKGEEDFGFGFPFVNLMDVFGKYKIYGTQVQGLVNSNISERKTYELRKGDILFIRSSVKPSGVGLTALVCDDLIDTVYSGFLIRFRDNDIIDLSYKAHCFYEEGFRKRVIDSSTVSANTNINQSALNKLKIAIPPARSEQNAIAIALSDADALITSLEKLIAKKRNIKQGAMQQLLKPKKGWRELTYGDVFDFLSTANYSRADINQGGTAKYIHYGDIHTKWDSFVDIGNSNLPTVRDDQIRGYNVVQEGDVIMADASEDYAGVGKSVEVINLNGDQIISGLHTFLMRDKANNFVNGFRGYIHSIKSVKSQFDRLATGLKVFGISKSNLRTVLIPVPPREEQSLITKTLRDMDTEIAKLETKLEKLKSIKQGMMQNLLTGKIRLI